VKLFHAPLSDELRLWSSSLLVIAIRTLLFANRALTKTISVAFVKLDGNGLAT